MAVAVLFFLSLDHLGTIINPNIHRNAKLLFLTMKISGPVPSKGYSSTGFFL